MFTYGHKQSPKVPGPEINVQVSAFSGAPDTRTVVCIIDTGATVSVLPSFLLEDLGLTYSTTMLKGVSGGWNKVKKSLVNLRIGSRIFNDQWVILCQKDYGLIGRDLLNAHLLTCNGPSATWEVEPDWL